MSQLSRFFSPKGIAVFGASERPGSMGGIVIQNLVRSEYKGGLLAVNLKPYEEVFGVPCVMSLDQTQTNIDLAVLCLPVEALKKAIRHLAKRGVKSAVLLTGGISRRKGFGTQVNLSIKKLADDLGVRVLGPNSMGVLVPAQAMNASFSHVNALPGNTAFVGQSAALGSSLLDWATGKGIGFSHFATIGAGVDVDISDLVDYLAADRRVKSILLHVENIPNPRKLMTALRAASRTKKVLAIRSGLNDQVPPGLKTRDRVDYRFFRRAGVLEVNSFERLFSGLEILSRMKPLYYDSLAIVTNGLGPAMMAKNSLNGLKGHLADLSGLHGEDQKEEFWYADEVGNNPLILPPNADAESISRLLKQIDRLPNLGAILLVHTPNQRSTADDLSEQLVKTVKACQHMVITNFVGNASVQKARDCFDSAELLNFESPGEAVEAFMIMVNHERNQDSLRETPPSKGIDVVPDKMQLQAMIDLVKSRHRDYFNWLEARKLLHAYGLELVASQFNEDLSELLPSLGSGLFPVSLRMIHQAYCYPFSHEEDPRLRWRSVAIQLHNNDEVEIAAKRLTEEKNNRFPDSKILGWGIQPMLRKMDYLQFNIGITRDQVVGPLIVFGEGGTEAETLDDRRFALPPLNSNHSRKLIYRSRAYKVLAERSADLEADVEVLAHAIMVMSQITIDLPEISGLEANCLLMPNQKLVCLSVAASLGDRVPTAISPYPVELEEDLVLKDGKVLLLRPIRAEDELQLKGFFDQLNPDDLRYRFFGSRLSFEHRELASMCQIDYEREMAFVAVNEQEHVLGEIRTWQDVNRQEMEFAVMVHPKMQGLGFGTLLMQRMIRYCRTKGVRTIIAEIMSDNKPMLALAKGAGFILSPPDDGAVFAELKIEP